MLGAAILRGGSPMGTNPWGANPWAMAAGNAGNPFASMAPFGAMAPFGSMPAFGPMAGVQSLLAMVMAPWGGMKPAGGDSVPWPWNIGAQHAGAWGMPSGGFGALPRWPVMMGAAETAAPARPELPWPWSMMGSMMGNMMGGLGGAAAATAPSRAPSSDYSSGASSAHTTSSSHGTSRAPSANAGTDDPMGISQMINFWSSLAPGAPTASPAPPEPEPEAKPKAPDLTVFFPWMTLWKSSRVPLYFVIFVAAAGLEVADDNIGVRCAAVIVHGDLVQLLDDAAEQHGYAGVAAELGGRRTSFVIRPSVKVPRKCPSTVPLQGPFRGAVAARALLQDVGGELGIEPVLGGQRHHLVGHRLAAGDAACC